MKELSSEQHNRRFTDRLGITGIRARIIRAIAVGMSDKEIAGVIHRSSKTVNWHIEQLKVLYRASNRVALMTTMIRVAYGIKPRIAANDETFIA